MASSASMISSRDARLFAKLSLRLNALVGGRQANRKCFGRPAFGCRAVAFAGHLSHPSREDNSRLQASEFIREKTLWQSLGESNPSFQVENLTS